MRIGEETSLLRVVAREVPLFVAPQRRAARRGTVTTGAILRVFARLRASGCEREWVLVGASAWACDVPGMFEPSDSEDNSPAVGATPFEFARVSERGAMGYGSIASIEQQLPDAELHPGFWLGIVEERVFEGEAYQRTTHNVWIAKRELYPVVPSDFEGVELDDGQELSSPLAPATSSNLLRGSNANDDSAPVLSLGTLLPHGWIYVDRATPRQSVQGAAVPKANLRRLTRLGVLEVRRHGDHRLWYRTTEGWLSDRELRVPTITSPPAEVRAGERWLDVDRHTQTLVAYVGATPVFATIVSTGRGIDTGPTATPAGLHRIWVKLASTDMDNLDQQLDAVEAADAPEPYAVEAVPFVAFFLRGYGLHATYWHDAFGTAKSHGCVNLSLRDAARIFEFTNPRLVPGWQAVHPDRYDPGTLVRVR